MLLLLFWDLAVMVGKLECGLVALRLHLKCAARYHMRLCSDSVLHLDAPGEPRPPALSPSRHPWLQAATRRFQKSTFVLLALII